VTSAALLDELDEKLRNKFGLSPDDADLIRARLKKSAEVVNPEANLSVIADDPDDDRVLECAVTGRVDYVVSGDRHLLMLGSFEGIPIMRVRQFLESTDIGF
jgi:putative PIN family toxin of toxin-antitoxin system